MTLFTIARPKMVAVGGLGRVPVPFIVGAERSGTTLLRMMLDAHPDLAIPPETHFIPKVFKSCAESDSPAATFLQGVTVDYLRWPDFHLDADQFRRDVLALSPFDFGAAMRIFYGMYIQRCAKPRFGDKTPGYVQRMPLIQRIIPEARFVHIIRDGRDVVLSLLSSGWWPKKPLAESADWWTRTIRQARAKSNQLAYYLEVRYETLLADTVGTLQRICDFIELPWDRAMLDYHQRAGQRLAELEDWRVGGGKVVAAQQRRQLHERTQRPPDQERVGRWKKEISFDDLRQFEGHAGELLAKLGYELAFPRPANSAILP